MEKIVVFTPTLNIGGIERILLTYARGLAEKRYEVTYLTLSDQGDFESQSYGYLVFENLGVTRLRKALFALVGFFKKNKPDIILCANEATMMVYIAKVLSGISSKIITSQHNYYENYLKMTFIKTFVPRYIYPRCFKVVAVSEGIRSMLINDFNNRPDNVVTISNPVDMNYIQEQALLPITDVPDDYILFVGRLDKVKNISLLIDTFKLFNQSFATVKLLIVGGGPELDSMKRRIVELGLESEVKILGVKSNPFPYIKQARIIVLSSFSEAFPTVLLESLVLGKTIVSTPTSGGIDILKNGKYGYLSNSVRESGDFYDKLVEAYNKPFDSKIVSGYALSNYNLNRKIEELECLWKG
ncbi:glycosyltransferase [Sphingobacterium tabacisoli]|uniref:Glycosyltransferase n=1 Tax=Sphingobacterium tabacisoli TaxID=2044855 RepID=A0ABW5KZ77_9SPHI|nr:glycosyltransferase [Sphingobacterium tabacisoli]